MTVQILHDTLAVLSSGKLCEEHGYTYEWANCQKPHLTKNGNRILCKTENFVLVVLPGLSSSSRASSSSTSFPQDLSSTSPSPARLRSDEAHAQASGKPMRKRKKDNNQAMRSRLRDLPEWSSQTLLGTQIRNVLRKWQPGSMVFVLTSQKDRSCEICKQTKITRAPCRRRSGEAAPRTENVGDLGTADHKVLNEGGESRNNHRYAVVVQDLATQCNQSYPFKTKTSQET